jgi:hypothetical protein
MLKLQSKQQSTFSALFNNSIRANIEWKDIESLIRALGGEILEGSVSRVRIYLNGIRAVFHRPHPSKITDKGAIKSVRRFIMEAGISDVKI